jgi:translocator protein
MKKISKLTISILLPILIGSVAGMFTAQAVPEWYYNLNKPFFAPPNWLFGPVWTVLYLLMGYSAFFIWTQPKNNLRDKALTFYFIQLVLNFAWSFLFFYFKQIGFALVEIVLLWLSILFMIRYFWLINPKIAYLNIPYLLWVTFATVLNAAYFWLN